MKKNKLIRKKMSSLIPAGGLVGLTVVSGLFLTMPVTFADDSNVVDIINITVPSSCNLNSTLDSVHETTINPGTSAEGIGTTTLGVFCNDGDGFAIYAIGYTGEEYGINTLVGDSTGQVINTGTNTSGNSSWAMKITKVTDTSVAYNPANMTIENSFGSYHNVPDVYTKVATFSSTTDVTLGAKVQTTYKAYISSGQPTDSYAGKVKYTLVHPANETPTMPQDAEPGHISYFPNADGVLDKMSDQAPTSAETSSGYVTLWASNYQRPGYGFAGWSTTHNYSDSNGFYGPNETIPIPSGLSTNGLSLYAYWVKSVGNFQDWTGCSILRIGEVTALTDTRDNNTYAVAKLADGKCWMIENLRLDTAASADESKAQGFGGLFEGLANPETANFTDSTTANSKYCVRIAWNDCYQLIDIGNNDTPEVRMPRYNNTNTASPVANMSSPSDAVYSYGNYYSWAAAIADTDFIMGAETETSLCPKGWKIPGGGDGDMIDDVTTTDYFKMFLATIGEAPADLGVVTQPYWNDSGSTEGTDASLLMRSYPVNFVYAGNMADASRSNVGSSSSIWSSSSSPYSDEAAFHTIVGPTQARPATTGSKKNRGRTVRCMLDD